MGLRRFCALLALALALGCLMIGHGLFVPALAGEGHAAQGLVDANLARAMATPVAELTSSVAAVCAMVLLVCAPSGFGATSISTLSLAAAATCVVDRFVLMPRVHQALGRVDLVTAAPAGAMAKLEMWELAHQAAVASASVLLAAVAWIIAHRLSVASHAHRSEPDSTSATQDDERPLAFAA
jgi:hypothetical protein